MNLYTVMPETPHDEDPLQPPTGLEGLLRRLQMVHSEAGQPTYRMIGKQIGMSASTICRIFNAKKPPPWQKLRRVLEVLKVPREDILTTWRELWRAAVNDAEPIPVRIVDGLTAPGQRHCPDCGTWIADDKAHNALHQRFDRLASQINSLLGKQETPPPRTAPLARDSTDLP